MSAFSYVKVKTPNRTSIVSNENASFSILSGSFLIEGTNNGSLLITNLSNSITVYHRIHASRINCIDIDLTNHLILSCSEDGKVIFHIFQDATFKTIKENISTSCTDEPLIILLSNPGNKTSRNFIACTKTGHIISYQYNWFTWTTSYLQYGRGKPIQKAHIHGTILIWSDVYQFNIVDITSTMTIFRLNLMDYDNNTMSISTLSYTWEYENTILLALKNTIYRIVLNLEPTTGKYTCFMSDSYILNDPINCIKSFDQHHILLISSSNSSNSSNIIQKYTDDQMNQSTGGNTNQCIMRIELLHKETSQIVLSNILPYQQHPHTPNGHLIRSEKNDGYFSYSPTTILSSHDYRDNLFTSLSWSYTENADTRGRYRQYPPYFLIVYKNGDIILMKVKDIEDDIKEAVMQANFKLAADLVNTHHAILHSVDRFGIVKSYILSILKSPPLSSSSSSSSHVYPSSSSSSQRLSLLEDRSTDASPVDIYSKDSLSPEIISKVIQECYRLVPPLHSDIWIDLLSIFQEYQYLLPHFIRHLSYQSSHIFHSDVYLAIATLLLPDDSEVLFKTLIKWILVKCIIDPLHSALLELLLSHLHKDIDRYKKDWIIESIALVYTYQQKYEEALSYYIKIDVPRHDAISYEDDYDEDDNDVAVAVRHFLPHHTALDSSSLLVDRNGLYSQVFHMIEAKNLYRQCFPFIHKLIRLSPTHSTVFLIQHVEEVDIISVTDTLRQQQDNKLLLWYLHLLISEAAVTYNQPKYQYLHDEQCYLYIQYHSDLQDIIPITTGPTSSTSSHSDNKRYLSPFLWFVERSTQLDFQKAFVLCNTADVPLHRELAYILNRIGRKKESIALYLEKCHDIPQAIQLLEETNGALWKDMLSICGSHHDMLVDILDYIGCKHVQPKDVLQKLSSHSEIKQLNQRFHKICDNFHFKEYVTRAAHDQVVKETSTVFITYNQQRRKVLDSFLIFMSEYAEFVTRKYEENSKNYFVELATKKYDRRYDINHAEHCGL